MVDFLTTLLKPRAWLAKLIITVLGLSLLMLDLMDYLAPIRRFLSSEPLLLHIGTIKLSAYLIIKSILIVILLFWLAGIFSEFAEKKINANRYIKKTNKALLIKALQIIVYFFSFIFGLDILGIDLTTLTVFSGAVGIGIGFGLQKVTSNFISGLILLFERSVEHDDLIELSDGTYGIVKHNSARYTLIETFDGKEIMVPNEDFITSRVINWTYSNTKGRIEINVGTSYDSDIEQVLVLLKEAAQEHPRCLHDPSPVSYLREFGDSSVNFLLFFWVADISGGRLELKSDVMRIVWRKLKQANIVIPYPQRDLHLKNLDVLQGDLK